MRCYESNTCVVALFVAVSLLVLAGEGKETAINVYAENGWGSAALRPAMIWQGFHFRWLRTELGFETPHRLGSVSSYISNVSSNCQNQSTTLQQNCSVRGTYKVQFTPGVSGDYAYPKVFYSLVASTNTSNILLLPGNWTFSFEDNSTSDPVPHAETARDINITLPLSQPLLPSQAFQLLLQGFQIEMKCIPSAAHPCNSDAIWAYYLNMSLAQDCFMQAEKKVSSWADIQYSQYCATSVPLSARLWCVLFILDLAVGGRPHMEEENPIITRWHTM